MGDSLGTSPVDSKYHGRLRKLGQIARYSFSKSKSWSKTIECR